MTDARRVPPDVALLLQLLGGHGDVPMRVHPVADHDRLSRLVTLLTRIDGVDTIGVQRFDGHDALLVARVVRAVAVDDILAARLARGMISCRWHDGRIEIELVARSTGAPVPSAVGAAGRFDVPPGLRALRITPPLRGVDALAAPDDRGPPERASSSPTPTPADDRLVELALRSIIGRSLLVCDTALRVLTAAGIAWTRAGVAPSGAGVRDVVDADTWSVLAPALADALAGTTATVEFDGPGGERFEATCTPVVDDRSVVGATAVARDLAVERDDRAAAGLLRDEFGAVFEQSPVAQGLLSIDGRWVRVNAELCAVLGESPTDLVGADATGWVLPEDRAGLRDRYARLLSGLGREEWATFRVLAARGHLVTVRVHVAVLRTPSGWPRGAIVQLASVQHG